MTSSVTVGGCYQCQRDPDSLLRKIQLTLYFQKENFTRDLFKRLFTRVSQVLFNVLQDHFTTSCARTRFHLRLSRARSSAAVIM